MTKKVLLVDDEPNVLSGFKRHLRKDYELHLAVGGQVALDTISEEGPFAVVVSDMQMPNMSGLEFLCKVREINDQTVRVMLTGNADQKTAVDAVNEGNIFRFLNKPCPPENLAQVLDAGLEHYRLVTAEAELLNKTLAGSVRMLTQLLSLTMPEAFGQIQKARCWARAAAEKLRVTPVWQVEMAAMLMRIGCATLPKDVMSEFLSGRELSEEHQALVEQTPQFGFDLISGIPRLEGVAEFIRQQYAPPRGLTPIASRIVRTIGDYQRFCNNTMPHAAMKQLEESPDYDPQVVKVLESIIPHSLASRSVRINKLQEGMVLNADVTDKSGRLLVASGMEVHEVLIQKLTMLVRSGVGVRQPIEVRVSEEESTPEDEESPGLELTPAFFEGE